MFDAVQAKLDANARRHNARSGRVAHAPLTGRIFDIDGQPMSPSFTHGQRGQVYRYYVSAPLQPGRRDGDGGAIRRVPGPALEALISAVIRRIAPAHAAEPLALPVRVEVHAEALQLLLPVMLLATVRTRLEPGETAQPDAADTALLRLILPVRMRRRGGRSWILGSSSPGSRRDPVLIKALRAAHAMLGADHAGLPVLKAAPSSSYPRRLYASPFLPRICNAPSLPGGNRPASRSRS